MADRTARAVVGYLACLVVNAALVAWTVALWWPPSENKEQALHKGFGWAADVCGSATFLGVVIPLVIAAAVLVIAASLPHDPVDLRLVAIGVGGVTLIAVLLPWLGNLFSSCVF
jgi:hypothetical protein